MASPSMTFNAEGNARAAASLAAGATVSIDLDFSAKIEGQITVQHNAGGTVSTTRGLQVRVQPLFGSTPTLSARRVVDAVVAVDASTPNSDTFYVGTGKWRLFLTNLDVTNALAGVAVTTATVDGMS